MPSETVPAEAVKALAKLSVEELLLPVLVQLIVIIVMARIFALAARRFGQTAAVGEILVGLLMGPSLLGWLAPSVSIALFHPSFESLPPGLGDAVIGKIFAVLSQIGLILLLFLVGLEFDFGHLRYHGSAALAISLTGVVMPFALGIGVGLLIHSSLEPHPIAGPVPLWGFALFLGVALSITSIPILARIMLELNITRTRLGTIAITSAAVDDAIGWILLATVAGIVRSGFEAGPTLLMVAETIGFVGFMIVIGRPLLVRAFQFALRQANGTVGPNTLTAVFGVVFLAALATNVIGIFAIFGAFLVGAVLSDQHEFREAVSARLRDIVTSFFLPIFFTYTGLRTNIGTLGSVEMWGFCLLVLAAAVLGKFGGCGLAARLSGFSLRESAILGVMMNTRALMGLIVINLGGELGVIPPSVFCMLVIMALTTTVVTTPLVLRLAPGTELEAPIRQSLFADRIAPPGSRPRLVESKM